MKTVIVHTMNNALVIAMLNNNIQHVQPFIEAIVNSPKPHTPDQIQAFRDYRLVQINAQADIKSLLTTKSL